MENFIGIEFFDKKYGRGACITRGNIFDRSELLIVVKNGLTRFGAHDIESIKVCDSLTQISDQPYFYECLIRFIQEPIPQSKVKYHRWVDKKRRAIKNRNDIYFNGFQKKYHDYLERKAKGFPNDED